MTPGAKLEALTLALGEPEVLRLVRLGALTNPPELSDAEIAFVVDVTRERRRAGRKAA